MKRSALILVIILTNSSFSADTFYDLKSNEESSVRISNKVSNGFYTVLPMAEFSNGITLESFSFKDYLNQTQNFFNFSKQFDFSNNISLELSYILDTNRVLYGNKLSLNDLSGLNLSLDYAFNSNLSDFRRYIGIDAGIAPAIHIGGEYYFNNNSYVKADLAVHALVYPSTITIEKKVVPVASLSYGVKF